MAIEVNDHSASSDGAEEQEDVADENDEDAIQPICPLDADAAASCLQQGKIKGVSLADLFDWQRLMSQTTSDAARPSCRLLFKKRNVPSTTTTTPAPEATAEAPTPKSGKASPLERIFPADLESEEVGIDIAACLSDGDEAKAEQTPLATCKSGCC